MPSSIQASNELKKRLAKHKLHPRETYEEVIARLADVYEEDEMELSDETLASIEQSRRDVARGKVLSTEELLEELGL